MAKSKILILTGGGTAGHVMPNLALVPGLRERGYALHYLGSRTGPERELAEQAGLPFHAIATGKLRRYFSWENFSDPFRVLWGMLQAWNWMGKLRPDRVFSKGGFVAVPVVVAAYLRRVPVILHESDLTPGLANRLCLPFCEKVCVSFPETLNFLPRAKAVLTGSPIRAELLRGRKHAGLEWLGFNPEKPVVLVMGGSLGAVALNQAVRGAWPKLQARYQLVHLCGRGKLDAALGSIPGYRQFEFLGSQLADVLAAADLVVSRAGANSLFELLALRKPTLLIPLPAAASRGDQILNAESFVKRGLAKMMRQEKLTPTTLEQALDQLRGDADPLIRVMEDSGVLQGTEKVLEAICTD